MGERKGVNKWYPPDYDPRKGGLNKWQGTHALRERARKLHLGILIIRFEMPYNIWCEGCGNHVGMGVRYNAEKTKVGMYYTTPIYQFRMKCHLCDNHFEIKTDPANLDYEIVSGARRQERRWDATQNGQVVPDDKAVGRKLADDAMFKLEHGSKDQDKSKSAEQGIKRLTAIQDRVKDDYLANRILRDEMRAKRKLIKETQATDNALLKKASLNIKLVPEHESDVRAAALFRLQPSETSEERQASTRAAIDEESIFASSSHSSSTPKTITRREKSRIMLTSLAQKHKLEDKQAKATSSRKDIGVVLKKTERVKEESSEEGLPPAKVAKMGEEEDIKVEELKCEQSTLSLCDYGSTSSESD